jgi:hypothetical protein
MPFDLCQRPTTAMHTSANQRFTILNAINSFLFRNYRPVSLKWPFFNENTVYHERKSLLEALSLPKIATYVARLAQSGSLAAC